MCAGKSCSSCQKSLRSVGPIVIGPIIASEETAGKYSIETKNRKTIVGGLVEKVYTGNIGSGSSAAAPVYAALVEAVGDVIRVVALQSYVDPAIAINPTADITTLADLQDYFKGTLVLTASQSAYIDHIVANVHSIFRAIGTHVSGSSLQDPTDLCSSGTSKLYQAEISTCLFAFKFIIS